MTLVAILLVAFVLGVALRVRASLVITSFLLVVVLILFVFGDAHLALDALTPFVYPRGAVAVFTILAAVLGYLITALLIERLGVAVLVAIIVFAFIAVITWPWSIM